MLSSFDMGKRMFFSSYPNKLFACSITFSFAPIFGLWAFIYSSVFSLFNNIMALYRYPSISLIKVVESSKKLCRGSSFLNLSMTVNKKSSFFLSENIFFEAALNLRLTTASISAIRIKMDTLMRIKSALVSFASIIIRVISLFIKIKLPCRNKRLRYDDRE